MIRLDHGTWREGGAKDPRVHPQCQPLQIEDAASGRVSDPLGRTKWAIVGFCTSTRMLAPFTDPEWIVMGCNQLYRMLPRWDAWAEIHARDVFLHDQVRDTNYLDWLRAAVTPILMHPDDYDAHRFSDIPTAVRFPIEAAMAYLGGVHRVDGTDVPLDYFQSTVAFQIAWALLHGAKEIGLWGVDLTSESEYAYQKPNCEFWLGVAKGRGVTITLPEQCALLKQVVRYGGPGFQDTGMITHAMIAKRRAYIQGLRDALAAEVADKMKTIDQMDAAMAESALWAEVLDLKLRGTQTEYDDTSTQEWPRR